jgi:transcription antitermination factor NusG
MMKFQNKVIRYCTIAISAIFIGSTLIGPTAQAQAPAEKAETIRLQLREMDQSICAPEYVGQNADSDLAAIANLEKYRAFLTQVTEEFKAQIETRKQPFANLGYTIDGMRQHLDQFEKNARQYGSREMIQGNLDHVLKMAKQSVEYQAPAYFSPGNDIHLRTESAKNRIGYLAAFAPDSDELKAIRQALEKTSAEVNKIKQSLVAQIVEQNEVPSDQYQGADKDKLIQLLREQWKRDGTKAKVLACGLVGTDWKRSVTWEVQNRTLYKVDRSRLQGYVIVEHDKQTAVRHSINLVKDHIDSDKIESGFLDSPTNPPDVMNQILLSKIPK